MRGRPFHGDRFILKVVPPTHYPTTHSTSLSMSDKLRPANAAGPNGLRGGIKTYTAKTITGPWLDELGGTAGYKRGFTNSDYETEAQHAQLGAIRTRAPEFGAELPDDIQLNRPSSPFRYQAGGKKENYWATNTQMMSQAMVTHSKVLAPISAPVMPSDPSAGPRDRHHPQAPASGR